MHHRVDPLQGASEPIAVAHVTQEETQLGELTLGVVLLLPPLFQLIMAVDHQSLDSGEAPQSFGKEGLPEAPAPPVIRIRELELKGQSDLDEYNKDF